MKNIDLKGDGCFCSLSTQIYTITLSQLIKEEKVIFSQDFIDNHYNSTPK